jgi:predicted metal-dependent hydrolase
MTAMQRISGAPAIKARKMNFPFSDIKEKYFFDNNTIISTYMAALSATFPPGEKGFIDSVRNYRDQITDPDLQEQIKGFIGQEGHHSYQHKEINKVLNDLGLFVHRIEKDLEKKISHDKGRLDKRDFLASTVGMEHITAIMAEYILENQHVLDPLPTSARELLLWHAVEEIEHKAVAFDVYDSCVGERRRLHIVMGIQTVLFLWQVGLYQLSLLRWAKKMPNMKDVVGAAKFFFGKDGMARNIVKPYLDYYRDDFHPWDNDNTALINKWKESRGYPVDVDLTEANIQGATSV